MAAIIDPSVEINPVIEYIESNNLVLDKVLITHTHHDHVYYLGDFIDLYPLMKVYASADARLPKTVNLKKIEHNDVVMVGKHFILSLSTPGHYMDSICYWVKSQNIIFTGDTMFVGRTGRTISSGSNIKDLYHSTYDILLKLPSDTVIFPGHHYGFRKDITLRENMKLSEFFQCKSFPEFDSVMKKFEDSRKK